MPHCAVKAEVNLEDLDLYFLQTSSEHNGFECHNTIFLCNFIVLLYIEIKCEWFNL